MTIYATIVPYICPRKETRVDGYVPFLFPLQELESHWSLLLDRGRPDAALPGWDAAVCLDFGRIRSNHTLSDGSGSQQFRNCYEVQIG